MTKNMTDVSIKVKSKRIILMSVFYLEKTKF
jgi:hypothetical protein